LVEHRKTKGLFEERTQLLDVSRFSSKVFEQAAGFLRLPNSKTILDSTGIHPERYGAISEMAKDLGVHVSDLLGEGVNKILESKDKWSQLFGEFTFKDIVDELSKPGRDPRDPFVVFQFREDINEVKDLKVDMVCPGIVSNVTNFGAFVDIGVHQDGLVHISELSNTFISDPREVIKPGDQVQVKILAFDVDKNQISLSMKLKPAKQETKVAAKTDRKSNYKGKRPTDGVSAKTNEKKHKPSGKKPMRKDNRSSNQRGKGPRQGQPFNNPFAALQGFKSE
jgi:uncharacterized protein